MLEKKLFQMGEDDAALLSINYGKWIQHNHAHIHVTCSAFETVLCKLHADIDRIVKPE